MSWDIYGHELRRGYCEVHPSVHESYPCSCCDEEAAQYRAAEEAAYYASMGGPCEGCLYATGHMQDCDGTCETLPYPEWDYFRSYPDETPPPLLPTMLPAVEVPF